MADHKVVVRKQRFFPFKPFWVCVCGHIFESEVMDYGLYREFKEHREEAKKRERAERRVQAVRDSARDRQEMARSIVDRRTVL